MPHFIQLSPAYWINADEIQEIRFCIEQKESLHFHIHMQGQEEELDLAPEEHMAFGLHMKAWNLALAEDLECATCFLEVLAQQLTCNAESE